MVNEVSAHDVEFFSYKMVLMWSLGRSKCFFASFSLCVGERVGHGCNGDNRMSRSLGFSALFVFSILTISFFGSYGCWFAGANASVSGLPPMNLAVVGVNGTEVVVLNETGIASLPSYSGCGGYENQIGLVKEYGNYTGVSLWTLCSLVGGLTNTSVVKVTAADNYTMNFTYAQVQGEFLAYDIATGLPTNHTLPFVPIIAYYLNGSNIPSAEGPLRLAIVSPEGYATPSAYWVKEAIRIEIIETSVPEYPLAAFLLSFLLTSLATMLSLKVRGIGRRTSCLPAHSWKK